MRKNTVTSKNRPPQNLTRFPNSRPKYTQTWHHVLKRPQPCINQIKYLHSQQQFYCSSWVKANGRARPVGTSDRTSEGDGNGRRMKMRAAVIQPPSVSAYCRRVAEYRRRF